MSDKCYFNGQEMRVLRRGSRNWRVQKSLGSDSFLVNKGKLVFDEPTNPPRTPSSEVIAFMKTSYDNSRDRFVNSIYEKFLKYGYMSEKQLCAIESNMVRYAENLEVSKDIKELFADVEPKTRMQTQAKLVKVKTVDGDYGQYYRCFFEDSEKTRYLINVSRMCDILRGAEEGTWVEMKYTFKTVTDAGWVIGSRLDILCLVE